MFFLLMKILREIDNGMRPEFDSYNVSLADASAVLIGRKYIKH
jgi:hypothetical protein